MPLLIAATGRLGNRIGVRCAGWTASPARFCTPVSTVLRTGSPAARRDHRRRELSGPDRRRTRPPRPCHAGHPITGDLRAAKPTGTRCPLLVHRAGNRPPAHRPATAHQSTAPVFDTGTYRAAINADRPRRAQPFTDIASTRVTWPDPSDGSTVGRRCCATGRILEDTEDEVGVAAVRAAPADDAVGERIADRAQPEHP